MAEPFFAACAPGLEAVTLAELTALGIAATPTPGGAAFGGGLEALYRANLGLRTASRVLARLGTPFYARTFAELVERAARLPWERFLHPGQEVALRVTCHKSRLYHSDAVAERLLTAIAARLGRPSRLLRPAEGESTPGQLLVVRLVDDLCTVSVDSSGESLHRRGYRLATAKAPLRETLAAGLVALAGWDATAPLLDPFCGSGTIAIEAALLARRIAPGRNRRFGFERWPGFEAALWAQICAGAVAAEQAECPPILASDRDAGAIALAQANAERAGVAENISFRRCAVSDIQPPAGPGWVVTNPPYGLRVSEGQDLRNLYAQFGKVLKEKCPGWQVAVLSSEASLLGHLYLGVDVSLGLVNGGVNVRLGRGRVPGR